MKPLFFGALALGTAGWAAIFWSSRGDAPTPPSPLFILGFSLFLGLCSAVVLTLVGMVTRSLSRSRPVVSLPQPGERALAQVAANHWQGLEARGGRLYLTTHALRFVPHRFNFSLDRVDLPLSAITGVDATSGLAVVTDDTVHRFVAPDPASLLAGIAAQARAAVSHPTDSDPAPPPPWVPVTPP